MLRILAYSVLVLGLAVPSVGCSKARRESSQLLNQGVKAFQRKQYDAAYSYFRKSIELDPENAQALYHMGQIDFYKRDDGELARTHLEGAKKLDPTNRDILFTLGRLKVDKLDEVEGGLTDLEAAIAVDENYHKAWFIKGKGLKKLGKNDEADAAWRECVTIDPKYSRCFVALGALYEEFEQEAAAQAVYDEGLKHSPGNPNMLNAMGVLMLRQGKYKEAVERFRGVLSRDASRMDSLFNLSFGYSEMSKPKKGDSPEEAKARKKKNLKKAISYLDKFIGMTSPSDKENLRAARSLKNALVTEMTQR